MHWIYFRNILTILFEWNEVNKMRKITVWETFHGENLDKLIDKAHETLPANFINSDQKVNVQFLNDEYVVTVTATREAKFHYEIMWDQCVKDDPVPAICKLQTSIDKYDKENIEIVKIADNDGLHIKSEITGDFSGDTEDGIAGDFNGSSADYESAFALIKVYDE